jgi:hypothetical protein
MISGLTNIPLKGLIGLRRRWNDYSTHDSFDLADTRSGFPTSYPLRRRTPVKFGYV